MSLRADLVTVFHNERNHAQAFALKGAIARHEPGGGYTFIGVDNRVHNRGFAAGCNAGAFTPGAEAPIIGFLNPDTVIRGPFLDAVANTLRGNIVITGCRFGKPSDELRAWGVTDWVCGAALFVTREWFTRVGGFDTQFVWGWEETDLIRQAERASLRCHSIRLPIGHDSPTTDTDTDAQYKHHYFQRGAQRFYSKWPRNAPGFVRR
jgi:GT2 family glycosyltransferase